SDRNAAPRDEDRGDRPATQDVSYDTLLVLVVGRLIDHEHVEAVLAVPSLVAVAAVEVIGIRNRVLAGGLVECSGPKRVRVREVRLLGQAVPVRHPRGEEQRVVVAEAQAGIRGHARGELPRRAVGSRRTERGVLHRAPEDEAGPQILPEVIDLLVGEVAAFLGDDGGRATGEARAVRGTSSAEGGLKEVLRSHGSRVGGATAACQSRDAAAIRHYYAGVGIGKRLGGTAARAGSGSSVTRQHVRNRIQVYWHVLVTDDAADVARFDHELGADLPLDCEVHLVALIGPEVRVQNVAGCGDSIVDAREDGLRQSRG